MTIPGVGRRTAELLVAEIGTDMRRFPTPAHLASWAGMCPGNHESAGKRRSGKTRKGCPWPRAGGRAGPPWRLARPSWSSPTTCCATAPTSTISVLTPSTSATVGRWNVGSCTDWRAWATPCPCNRQLRNRRQGSIFRPRWGNLRNMSGEEALRWHLLPIIASAEGWFTCDSNPCRVGQRRSRGA